MRLETNEAWNLHRDIRGSVERERAFQEVVKKAQIENSWFERGIECMNPDLHDGLSDFDKELYEILAEDELIFTPDIKVQQCEQMWRDHEAEAAMTITQI